MPESPPDRPLMTITPDGYVPRRIQMEKVKGSSPSLRQPDKEDQESPTAISNGFMARNMARASLVVGIGVSALYGSYVGEGITTGNKDTIIFGAVGAGLSLAAVTLNATALERLSRK